MRFDDAAELSVDFSRSVGVIGQNRKGNTLYVALDEARDEMIVALAPEPFLPPPHETAALCHRTLLRCV